LPLGALEQLAQRRVLVRHRQPVDEPRTAVASLLTKPRPEMARSPLIFATSLWFEPSSLLKTALCISPTLFLVPLRARRPP
jgi:hypothetical protein